MFDNDIYTDPYFRGPLNGSQSVKHLNKIIYDFKSEVGKKLPIVRSILGDPTKYREFATEKKLVKLRQME